MEFHLVFIRYFLEEEKKKRRCILVGFVLGQSFTLLGRFYTLVLTSCCVALHKPVGKEMLHGAWPMQDHLYLTSSLSYAGNVFIIRPSWACNSASCFNEYQTMYETKGRRKRWWWWIREVEWTARNFLIFLIPLRKTLAVIVGRGHSSAGGWTIHFHFDENTLAVKGSIDPRLWSCQQQIP